MKHLFKAVKSCKLKIMIVELLNYLKLNTTVKSCSMILTVALIFTSCTKQDLSQFKNGTLALNNASTKAKADSNIQSNKTPQELEEERRVTEKYRSMSNAIANGYVDVIVVMKGM